MNQIKLGIRSQYLRKMLEAVRSQVMAPPEYVIPRMGEDRPLYVGALVEVRVGKFCGKRVKVKSIDGSRVEVGGGGWSLSETYQFEDLELIRRSEDEQVV